MSLKCKLFGHKVKKGEIKTYEEILRCQRCSQQVVYPEDNILVNELKWTADAMEKVNKATGKELYSENKITDYELAAELIKEKEG